MRVAPRCALVFVVFVDFLVFFLPGGNAVERIVAVVDECLHSVCDRMFLCSVLLCTLFARKRHGHEFSDAAGNFARLTVEMQFFFYDVAGLWKFCLDPISTGRPYLDFLIY